MNIEQLKPIIECALLTGGEPLSLQRLRDLFSELPTEERPDANALRAALAEIAADCESRGVELKEIASGFCFQAKMDCVPWIKKLWQERPPRYSRALLETLAVIAYQQPVTRAEIEDIRGVGVSTNIVKTLLDHEWIQVVGQREVPGRPSLYATTRQFLDHFNLKTLEELPALIEPQDLIAATEQLELNANLPVAEVEVGTDENEKPTDTELAGEEVTNEEAKVMAEMEATPENMADEESTAIEAEMLIVTDELVVREELVICEEREELATCE